MCVYVCVSCGYVGQSSHSSSKRKHKLFSKKPEEKVEPLFVSPPSPTEKGKKDVETNLSGVRTGVLSSRGMGGDSTSRTSLRSLSIPVFTEIPVRKEGGLSRIPYSVH